MERELLAKGSSGWHCHLSLAQSHNYRILLESYKPAAYAARKCLLSFSNFG